MSAGMTMLSNMPRSRILSCILTSGSVSTTAITKAAVCLGRHASIWRSIDNQKLMQTVSLSDRRT
jgi:hypothetical protein